MELAPYVDVARRHADDQMKSTCTITRAGVGKGPWNPETGTYSPPARQTVYSGRCKVQDNGRAVTTAEAGAVIAAVDSLELHLPVEGSEGVRRDDVAHIDSNPLDAALVGREFVVRGPHAGTAKTARRLPIEAVY